MSKVMEFKAKFIGDVSDITSNIKDLQQELNKLTLPDNLKGQFTKVINNLEKNTEKASKSLAAGFKTKGDVSSYEKTMNLIVSDMEKLSILMSRIDTSKLDFKVDGTQIKALVEYIAQLKAQINAISTKKLTEVQEIASKRSDTKKNAASWTEFFEAFKKGDEGIDDCEKALKRLQNQVNKAAEKVGGVENLTGKWAEYAKDVKVYEDAFSALKGNSKELVPIKEELIRKEEELKNIQEKYTEAGIKSVQDAIESTKQMTEGTKQYAKESGEAAENTQQLNNSLDSFKNKAAYFFGLSNAVNLFKRAVRSAFETVKELDAVMTETAVVTSYDVGDMWDQLPEYTQRANELGVSIHDAYKAATLYYQQGLKTNEVMAVSNETLKMARIAGLDAAEATSRMTNALRGFNMEINEDSAQRVNDVYSKLAAITASDTNEISTAMTKVASLAHNANMEFETTSAFLAQMIETTRESAETAGTALKTVIARFSEVKKLYSEGDLMGTDEEGEEIDVNKVSTALRSAGINMNEYLTGAKGLDDIFIELASKWDSLDMIQQRYIATMAAGSRQQSRFIAMMSDYKRTMELVGAANTSAGASQKQFEKTLESLQSKLAQLSNSWKTFLMGIADNAVIKTVIDLLTKLLDTINTLFSKIDGIPGSLARIGAAFGVLKGGQAITKKLFGDIGQAMGTLKEKGEKNGKIFGLGFINGAKQLFSKKYWNSMADVIPEPEIDTYKEYLDILEDEIKKFSEDSKKYAKMAEDSWQLVEFDENDKIIKESIEEASRFETEAIAEQIKAEESLALSKTQLQSINNITASQEEKNALLRRAAVDDTIALKLSTGDLTRAEIEEIYAEERINDVRGKSTLQLIAATFRNGEWTASLKKSTLYAGLNAKAEEGNIAARFMLSIANNFAIKTTFGLVAATAAYVAVIGLAIFCVYKLIKYFMEMAEKSPEQVLEETKEATDAVGKAADEAAESLNNLKSSLESLNEKYEGIEDLTRGTKEWKEAVREVNSEVLNLMGTYEGLKIVNENGILKITNAEEINDQLAETSARLEAMEIGAQQEQVRAQLAVDFKDSGLGEIFEREEAEQLAKGLIAGTIDAEQLKADNYQIDDEVIQDLVDFGNKLSAATEQIDMYSEALATNAMENVEFAKNTEDVTRNYFNANRMEEIFREEYNKTAEASEKDIKKAAAKLAGKKETDEDYDEYIKQLNLGSALSQVAQARARKRISQEAQGMSSGLSGIDEGTLKYIQAIYSSSGLGGLSEEDLESLNEEGLEEVATKITEALWDLKSEEEKANSNRAAFEEDIRRDVFASDENSRQGFEQYAERMHNMYVTNADTFGVSADVANGLADKFEDIFMASGSTGIVAIQDKIKDIIENNDLDKSQAAKFITALSNLDWKNANNVDTLQDSLKAYGLVDIEIGDLTEDIIKLANASRKVDLESLTEKIQGLASLATSLKNGKQGATGWSKENVQRAIASGAATTKDFVINTEDGSYTYIGEKLDAIYDKLAELVDEETSQVDLEERVRTGQKIRDLSEDYDLTKRDQQESFLSAVQQETSGVLSLGQVNALQGLPDGKIQELVDSVMKNTENLEADEQALWDLKVTTEALNNTNEELAKKADEGDDVALAALQGNARASGMSDQLYNANKDDPNALNAITSIFEEAQSLDIDADELSDYIKNLKKAHRGLSDVAAAQIALANTKYINGLKKIIDSYDSWTKLLKEDGTLMTDLDKDSAKIIEDFKDAASEMLGVELSDNFFYGPEAEKNIALLKQLTEQGEDATEALRQLEIQAAKDYAISLGLNENDIDKVLNYVSDSLLESEDWLKLEIGASIDDAQFTNGLVAMMNNLGLSVDQMNAMFDTLGFSLEQVPVKYTYSGIYLPNGQQVSTIATPIEWKYVVRKNKNAKSPTITPPKSSGGSGGSGSSKEEKPDYWENPFDELYNLQEKINEALRTREALERKYQKLLKQTASNLSEVTKAYYDQITHLREEANLQQQMQEGRARQLNNIGNEIYTDSEGNRATFASLGVMKYASYDQNTGVITIDWPALEEIASDPSRTAEGEAAEAYIKRLEELSQQFEEVRDKLWDIEDQIETLQQEAIDSYLTFEDRVMEALKNQYQQEIDDFKALSDTIKNATDEIIDGIQDDVELARQIRDNTKKEEDIAEKEARLAYLRRDTSGANDLEIKKLEKELEQEREDYSDTLVDQQIAQMQKDAEDAAKQREKQIELMQHALDMAIENGELWEEVYGLIASSVDPQTGVVVDESPLMDLLRSQEAFGSLSKIGQEKWWEDTIAAIKEALVGLGVAEDHYNIGDEDRRTGTSISTFMDRLYEQILGRNADEAGKEYWSELIQSGKMSRADVIKSFLGSEEFRNRNLGNEDFIETLYQSFFGRAADKEGKEYWVNQLKSGARSRDDIINEFFNSLEWTNSLLPRKSEEQGPTMGAKKPTGTSYSSGALPELVLDAKDTENFIALRDVLANLLGTEGAAAMKTNGGDTYFDINIDAEIGSDYDVDKLAEQIEKKIYNLGSYRNANVIRGLR